MHAYVNNNLVYNDDDDKDDKIVFVKNKKGFTMCFLERAVTYRITSRTVKKGQIG